MDDHDEGWDLMGLDPELRRILSEINRESTAREAREKKRLDDHEEKDESRFDELRALVGQINRDRQEVLDILRPLSLEIIGDRNETGIRERLRTHGQQIAVLTANLESETKARKDADEKVEKDRKESQRRLWNAVAALAVTVVGGLLVWWITGGHA